MPQATAPKGEFDDIIAQLLMQQAAASPQQKTDEPQPNPAMDRDLVMRQIIDKALADKQTDI